MDKIEKDARIGKKAVYDTKSSERASRDYCPWEKPCSEYFFCAQTGRCVKWGMGLEIERRMTL